MTKKISVFCLGLIICSSIHAQNNVFAFFEYDIKDDKNDPFVNGYEKDLEWHQSQGDDWSWIGWFVVNGPRRGRFIDATPNHDWRDFDHWKVNGAENTRHNDIHWVPYVENSSGSYKTVVNKYSSYSENWFQHPYLQVYHLKIKNGKDRVFQDFLEEYISILKEALKDISFVWMKTISGGAAHEYQLFIGMDKIENLESCEILFNFPDSQKKLAEMYDVSVEANSSELWKYSDKLSLIPK